MKFRIHFTMLDRAGEPVGDSIVIEANSIEEIREQAGSEISLRGGREPWSEEIKGGDS